MDKPVGSQHTDKKHLTDTVQAPAGSDTKTKDVSTPTDIDSMVQTSTVHTVNKPISKSVARYYLHHRVLIYYVK